jgi:hypothetical protein
VVFRRQFDCGRHTSSYPQRSHPLALRRRPVALAEQMNDPQSRQLMHRVAAYYERRPYQMLA